MRSLAFASILMLSLTVVAQAGSGSIGIGGEPCTGEIYGTVFQSREELADESKPGTTAYRFRIRDGVIAFPSDFLTPAPGPGFDTLEASQIAPLFIDFGTDPGTQPCYEVGNGASAAQLIAIDVDGTVRDLGSAILVKQWQVPELQGRLFVRRVGGGELSLSVEIIDEERCCCEGNLDPCCGSADPCCGNPDPCCGDPNPCCNDPDPCCGVDCDDEDPCTSDSCKDGACSHEPDPCCGTCDDGNECTNDICEDDGSCSYEWICEDDENICTHDYCQEGECHHDPKCDDENECTADSCDPETGACTNKWPCEEPTDPCDERVCINGECQIQPKDCDDENECTTDYCDPATGECVNEWPCEESPDKCIQRSCIEGECVYEPRDCDDGSECTDDWCDPDIGCVNESICDDGNECTEDTCVNGACAYEWFCDDNDPCTDDSCSEGECIYDPKDCDDGDACTIDYCDNGNCEHDEIICDDKNECTDDYCDPDTGECVYVSISEPRPGCDCGESEPGPCNEQDDSGCGDSDCCTQNTCEIENGYPVCVINPISGPQPEACGESDPGPCNEQDDPGCGDSDCCTQNKCYCDQGYAVCMIEPAPAGHYPEACGESDPGPCNECDDPGCGDSNCCTDNECHCDGEGNPYCLIECAPCCEAWVEPNVYGCPGAMDVLIPNSVENIAECDGTFCWSLEKTGGNATVSLPSGGCTEISAGTGVGFPVLVDIDPSSPPGSTATLKFKVTVDGKEKCSATTKLTVVGIEFVTPDGDPVASPDNTGVGQNQYTFSNAATGEFAINFRANVIPNTQAAADAIVGGVTFDVDAVGASTMTWDAANPGGKATLDGMQLVATVTFSGLPANNADFGTKSATVDCHNTEMDQNDIEVFYTGTATNHPGGTATHQNWFHYYQQNEGGANYTYGCMGGRSWSQSGVPGSVEICDEAYSGDEFITTNVAGGQLTATGASATNYYYANFLGVLAHETQHATNQINTGPPNDMDSDRLENRFETGTSQTDPNDACSAAGVFACPPFFDREVYAGGPVEEGGIAGANTSQDWANPGTNY